MAKKKRGKSGSGDASELSREELLRRVQELERANEELKRSGEDLTLENLVLRWEVERIRGRRPGEGRKLFDALDGILEEWRDACKQSRVFERLFRLARGFLLNLGRHTITGALCALGRDQQDWSADYRVFSKARFAPSKLFFPLLRRTFERCRLPFFPVAIDDSQFAKTGKHIPDCRVLRDPLSPPYHPNLRWASRFLQMSALVWSGEEEPARGIPVDFALAPPPKKPRKNAPPEVWESYRQAQRTESLGCQAARMTARARAALDDVPGGRDKPMMVCADASMANKKFLRALPKNVEALVRIRRDAALWAPAAPNNKRRVYGERLRSPDAMRQDPSIPWRPVTAFAAGRTWEFRVKEVGPVLWRHTTLSRPWRLILIAPPGYRPNAGHRVVYREPAYLLCSDMETPIGLLLQTYVHRWEIEVNFRDEKTVLGLGQAQVWSPESVERAPALLVATYSALLLASLEAFGTQRTADYLDLPLWRQSAPPIRPSANDLIHLCRQDAWIVYDKPSHSSRDRPESEWPACAPAAISAMLVARQ